MKKLAGFVVMLIIFVGCSDQPGQAPTTAAQEKKTDSFFPVTSFIRGQLLTLDSLPITPLQRTTSGKKQDSSWVAKKDLRPLLAPFLQPEITETNFTKYFTETSFNDQTLNAVTFTYDPSGKIPDTIQLRHWDVYVNPETGKVTKVYLVKNLVDNNRSLTQQLTWQTNKLARITTLLNKPDGTKELVKQIELIWDFSTASSTK